MENYLEALNESQREAVAYIDGPSLVVAGAGSGKTRVLTYKVAHLLAHDFEPWSILALTFTNKAAREMKERIAQQVGEERARYLWMGTFHSIFSRILRQESIHLGFPSSFTIYDQSDSRNLLKTLVREMALDEKKYKPADIQSRISRAKNALITPRQYEADRQNYEQDLHDNIPFFRELFQKYCDRCKAAGSMDFDDLLVYTHLLFATNAEVLTKYQHQFRYILVDEYQDTNYAQHSIVMQLAAANTPVCVVGDDAQSIYSFRGAKIDNILKFQTLFPSTRLFKLEQNYRSTQTIVNAANSLIAKNRDRIQKKVFSENAIGDPISLIQAYSDVEEGSLISQRIESLCRLESVKYDEVAILYRTNAQSRIFEEALRKRSIPYRIYGGLSFYQRKEIKDLVAYFRLTVNPLDEEAMKRVINYPTRGIGATTLTKIIASASSQGVSLWQVISNLSPDALALNKGTVAKLQQFAGLIQSFIDEGNRMDAYALAEKIAKESGVIADVYQDRTPENLSRQENIQELMNGLQSFCEGRREVGDDDRISMADFLSEVSLLTDQDTQAEAQGPSVTLMTVHAAKGLEFGQVFVVGMEEDLFPSAMAGNSARGLEEERRLFYVAITRAKERCFLSYAKSRFRYGKMEFSNPSRFLADIDDCYVSRAGSSVNTSHIKSEESMGYGNYRSSMRTESVLRSAEKVFEPVSSTAGRLKRVNALSETKSTPPATNASTLSVGQQVLHERFGRGRIQALSGAGENAKATICFENSGEKQLLLRFARITVVL
ncbi:MAG: UvrD-helicase domain-containing protein [Bacteroidaceae bacterium]|nr:UvrD-helicase domain-containing protein [Bacteroidaceae bacterium]